MKYHSNGNGYNKRITCKAEFIKDFPKPCDCFAQFCLYSIHTVGMSSNNLFIAEVKGPN